MLQYRCARLALGVDLQCRRLLQLRVALGQFDYAHHLADKNQTAIAQQALIVLRSLKHLVMASHGVHVLFRSRMTQPPVHDKD
jgi:hypothetical protein